MTFFFISRIIISVFHKHVSFSPANLYCKGLVTLTTLQGANLGEKGEGKLKKVFKIGCFSVIGLFVFAIATGILVYVFVPEEELERIGQEQEKQRQERDAKKQKIMEQEQEIKVLQEKVEKLESIPPKPPEPSPEEKLFSEFKLQFSRWDGSHKKTVEYIKERMHNPKSFEHVETTYLDLSKLGYRIIEMKYRGTNAFSAIVTNATRVKVDLDGNIISVLQTK